MEAVSLSRPHKRADLISGFAHFLRSTPNFFRARLTEATHSGLQMVNRLVFCGGQAEEDCSVTMESFTKGGEKLASLFLFISVSSLRLSTWISRSMPNSREKPSRSGNREPL